MSYSPQVISFLGSVAVSLEPVQRFRNVIGEPDPWRERLLRTDPMQNETDQMVLTLVGRQSGKSTTCRCLAYDDFTRGKTVILTAPSLRQAQELFRRILEFKLADEFYPPIVRQTQTELEAHPRHGGRIVCLPATDHIHETGQLLVSARRCSRALCGLIVS